MMIVRKVIEYIYDKYVLSEQQQQQQQNLSGTSDGNGTSKNTSLSKQMKENQINFFF